VTTVDTMPSIEAALVAELTTQLGSQYRFMTILPQDILDMVARDIRVTRIKRISGAMPFGQFYEDRPVVDVDTFFSDYATADLASRNIQAALQNLRGKQLMIGVVQTTRVIVGPRWLPDPNASLFRFSASYQFHFHRGGRTA
jgi:hypothetical protein